MWDDNVVCRDINGDLVVYGHFSGGVGYWVNQDWFAGHGLQRFLDRLLLMYPISKTYHLDVLTTRASNVDFNPEHPCNWIAGYLGRLKQIESFNMRGLDVTSEGFMSWFVGKIGHAWLLRCDPMSSILGEEAIPFVPFIYHGHATYGQPSELNPLWGILYGTTCSVDLAPRSPFLWKGNSLLDCLYLQNFPFQMLRQREITNYERHGDVRRVDYGVDSYVEVDVSDANLQPYQGYKPGDMGHFKIVVDGHEIAKDFTAFVSSPRSGGDYLAYSKLGGTVTYPLPKGWSHDGHLTIEALLRESDNNKFQAEAKIVEGNIVLTLPSSYPVRIRQK